MRGENEPCGLWQSTQDMAPSGKRCLNGLWNEAHWPVWHDAHCALIAFAERGTRPAGPFL